MKRLLLVFLLSLLPLQAVWATAARYCAHEQTAPQHVGHHEHEHSASESLVQPASNSSDADLDCGVCHLACSVSVPTYVAFDLPLARASMCELARSPFRSRATPVPDRPDIAGASIAVRFGGMHASAQFLG